MGFKEHLESLRRESEAAQAARDSKAKADARRVAGEVSAAVGKVKSAAAKNAAARSRARGR
jgi:hypothetical protein